MEREFQRDGERLAEERETRLCNRGAGRGGGERDCIAVHPCVNVTIPAIPPSLHPLPSCLQRLLSPPLSRDHLHGVCLFFDRGVPGVSTRRPPPGVRRSAGGNVQVPAGLRVHVRRESWLGAAGETRLDPLSDAGDAGSDRATEHLLGYHRHSFRWDP